MTKNFQHRDKFFYVTPQNLPNFDDYGYQDRRCIGINLEDFWHDEGIFRVEIEGGMYEISALTAIMLARKYTLKSGTMPNLIPLQEFRCVQKPFPKAFSEKKKEPKNQGKLF